MPRKAIPPTIKNKEQIEDVGASKIERQQRAMPTIENDKLLCPSDLTKGAKKEWKRIVKLYKECNVKVFNDLDIETIKSYCIAVDMRNQLYKKWTQEQGCDLLTENDKGEKKVNPIMREIDRYSNTIRILSEQLALTPVGRAAFAIRKEKENKSEGEAFMGDE